MEKGGSKGGKTGGKKVLFGLGIFEVQVPRRDELNRNQKEKEI